MSSNTSPQVSVNDLTSDHRVALADNLNKILSTKLAERLYSCIICGRPTPDIYRLYGVYNEEIREELRNHVDPCAFAIERYGTLAAYQACSVGTKAFNIRLSELTAVALHRIAAHLHVTCIEGPHKQGRPIELYPEKIPEWYLKDPAAFPTRFYFTPYLRWHKYPLGIADTVGYCAELVLFGGVVIFGRGESGTEANSAYIHPSGNFMTYKLSSSQLEKFANLASLSTTTETDASSHLSTLCKSKKYAKRVDSRDAMRMNIYRDKYERPEFTGKKRQRCVIRAEDFPPRQHQRDHRTELKLERRRKEQEAPNQQNLGAEG